MCLLVAAWRAHPRYRLIVMANRDEFHARPAEALRIWGPPAELLAGRDVQAGGTWLGADRARRFGVITNYREMARPRRDAPSRGRLIVDYLAGPASAWDFANNIETDALSYAGFSLLLADSEDLVYACNRADQFARRLPPGVYGLSNHLLDTPWPKLLRVRAALKTWTDAGQDEFAPLWAALADRDIPNDSPGTPEMTTGLDPAWGKVLASPFVMHPEYGTRCSTLSLITDSGAMEVHERRFDADGLGLGETVIRLAPGEWSAGKWSEN
jgi:uncharacterized protein with NRDE domain